jgi:hypothetical protein
MPDSSSRSDYLGDGVYAQYMPTGNMICLFVERASPGMSIEHGMRIERVCLEPEVFDALLRFAALCWPEKVEEPTV